MPKGIDTDFTGRFSFLVGIPFPRPDFFNNLSCITRILWYVYLTIPQMITITIYIGSFYQLITTPVSNMQIFAFNFIAVIFLTSTIVKLLIFIIKYNDFNKTYNQMRMLSHEFSLRNDGFDEIYNSYMGPVMKFGKIRASLELVSSMLYLLQLIITSFFNDKNNRQLPMEMKLPYYWKENPVYSFTVSFQTFGGLFGILRSTGIDIVLLTILIVPAAQLNYLKKFLEGIISNDNEKNEEEKFYWFIKSHQNVLRIVENFKHLCVYHLCLTYGASMMDLFLTGMVVTTPDLDWELTKTIVIIGNIITHVLQLYVLCFAADILTNAGLTTVSAGISSKLFIRPREIKRGFLFALSRSIKPIRFTIAGLYPLCSSTFMDMIRLTATYFVTVVQIRDRFSENLEELEHSDST